MICIVLVFLISWYVQKEEIPEPEEVIEPEEEVPVSVPEAKIIEVELTLNKLMIPDDVEIVRQYEIGEGEKSLVTIFRKENEAKLVYHLSPPEYSLD